MERVMRNYEANPIPIPKCGISEEQIVNIEEIEKNEDLKCPICLNVVWKPIQCKRCEKYFCKYCLNESIRTIGNKCPMCRLKHFKSNTFQLKESCFKNIRIKCPYKNCNEKRRYFKYIIHLKKCKNKLYHCTNEGCNYEDNITNMQKHEIVCPKKVIPIDNLDNKTENGCINNIEPKTIYIPPFDYNSTHCAINQNEFLYFRETAKFILNYFILLYAK